MLQMLWSQRYDSLQDLQMMQSLRDGKEGKLPLLPRKNGPASLFKEVRVLKSNTLHIARRL